MSKEIEINKIELQEMARAILCELYDAEKSRGKLADSDSFEEADGANFRFFNDFDELDRRLAGFADTNGAQRQNGSPADSSEPYFRLKHKGFLEHRSESAGQRESYVKNTAVTLAEAERGGVKQYGSLTQEVLPEKLSDIFCRDARRYNGAFERY